MGNHWEQGAHMANGKFNEYEGSEEMDIVGEWVDKPEWDWEHTCPWFVALAMDFDERWVLFCESVPSFENCGRWLGDGDNFRVPTANRPNWQGDAKDSLVIRPGHDPK